MVLRLLRIEVLSCDNTPEVRSNKEYVKKGKIIEGVDESRDLRLYSVIHDFVHPTIISLYVISSNFSNTVIRFRVTII